MTTLAAPPQRRSPRAAEREVEVAIVGGGVSGLAAAHALQRGGISFRLMEGSGRWGGVVRTERTEGFLLEGGPDNLLAQKDAWRALAEELGISHRIVPANMANRSTWLLHRDRLLRFPDGMALAVPTRIFPFVRSRLFSLRGKLRMAAEPWVKPAVDQRDESVASFLRRRLGPEAVQRIGQPLLAGIHAADVERLSLRAAFPMLAEMEDRHGSLLRAVWKTPRVRSKGPAFYTLLGGVGELVDALVAALPRGAGALNSPVSRLEKKGDTWLVHSRGVVVRASAVILAVPPVAAAKLLGELPALAARLAAFRSAASAVVLLGFRRGDVAHPLDGHGLLATHEPLRRISGCTFASTKFPGRAPAGHVLLRAFVGGALDERVLELSDAAIVDRVIRDLDTVLGFRRWPVVDRVFRWPAAMPQMDVGHLDRVAEVEQAVAAVPGLYLAGPGLRVTGVPDCIAEARRVAMLAGVHAAETARKESPVTG